MKKKELSFITVIGKDRKGIVAHISGLLFRSNVNIEDISQKIMEGFFVMAMLVDMSGARISPDELAVRLKKLGDSLGMTIQVQHENIFKMMHRV